MTGHSKPHIRQTASTARTMAALAMCLQFQDNRKSMP